MNNFNEVNKFVITFLVGMQCFFGRTQPEFFNEVRISMNQTNSKIGEDQFGFGAGIYKIWRDSSRVNILSGVSYDLTRQFDESVSNGHFSNISDVQYTIHDVSIPLACRLNMGKAVQFFVEPGIFASLGLGGIGKGTVFTQLPGESAKVSEETFGVTSRGHLGLALGSGLSFPINDGGKRLLLRTDYKFGFGEYSSGGQSSLFNRYFRFTVGLKF